MVEKHKCKFVPLSPVMNCYSSLCSVLLTLYSVNCVCNHSLLTPTVVASSTWCGHQMIYVSWPVSTVLKLLVFFKEAHLSCFTLHGLSTGA